MLVRRWLSWRIFSSCPVDGTVAPASLRYRAASPDHPHGAPWYDVEHLVAADMPHSAGKQCCISVSHMWLSANLLSGTITTSPLLAHHIGSMAPSVRNALTAGDRVCVAWIETSAGHCSIMSFSGLNRWAWTIFDTIFVCKVTFFCILLRYFWQ